MSGSGWKWTEREWEWVKYVWKWVGVDASVWEHALA